MSYEELLPGLDSASPFSTMSSASFDSAIGDMFGAALTPSASGKGITQSSSVNTNLDLDTCYGSPSKISIDSLLYEPACDASWPGPPTPPLSAPPYPGQLPPPPRLSVISGPAPPHPGHPGHPGHHPHRHQRRKHEESVKLGPGHAGRGPRQEVEHLCVRLMCQYQQCLLTIPPSPSLLPQHGDSLVLATRLLSEAVARMRLFLSGLDTFNSLTPGDRATLYRHNVCSMQILKSSLSMLSLIFPDS